MNISVPGEPKSKIRKPDGTNRLTRIGRKTEPILEYPLNTTANHSRSFDDS